MMVKTPSEVIELAAIKLADKLVSYIECCSKRRLWEIGKSVLSEDYDEVVALQAALERSYE